MEKKTICCPRCHGILEVTNSKAEPVLLITCPNPACGAKMRVTFDTGETILADTRPKDNLIGHLNFKGETYALKEGINTIGRQSPNSAASLQLPTDDHTMSRLHVRVEVIRLKSGRVKAVVSDLRNADKMRQVPTLIDDEPLQPEDTIVLSNGDILTLGRTRVKYVI